MQDPTPGPTPTPRPSRLTPEQQYRFFSPMLGKDDPLMTLDNVSAALAYLAWNYMGSNARAMNPIESDGLHVILRTLQGAVEFVKSGMDPT